MRQQVHAKYASITEKIMIIVVKIQAPHVVPENAETNPIIICDLTGTIKIKYIKNNNFIYFLIISPF